MSNIYEIKKNIDKIRSGRYTYFLNPRVYREISYKLRNCEYKVYYIYPDSDKVILYTDKIPTVRLFEIESYFSISHSEIMGSLFGLNISEESFGDIIVDNGKYYFYVMDEIADFIKDNLCLVGNNPVKVKEIDIHLLDDYRRKYEECSAIVSSLRIDSVISKIICTSRDKVKDKIRNKEIIINYDVLNNNSYVLKNNDVFSIRRFGKYKFIGILKITKKDNYIIKYYKYL